MSSPPEPLNLSVHSLPALDPDQKRTGIGRFKMLLIWAVCAAPVVASYLTYYVIRPQGHNSYGELIEPQRPLPPRAQLQLTDAGGSAVDPASLRGQWLLIVVAGGDCNEACERQLYAQRQLREMMGRDKDRLDRVWLVDDGKPVRAALLPAMRQATVLHVPREQLAAWLKPAPGQSLEAHFYLVDPMGNWMMRFPAHADPSKVKTDLGKLMRASASWDQEGRDPAPRPRPAGGLTKQ
ncbi:MAG: hypothetical protein EPO01_02325 [Aquabacterium sp.]|nr:MAG: hypothetical protein EPO01_02325 [Aquabacterium sp.]